MMENCNIRPGQLIYLIDRNPNYKNTCYEKTVSAHREGSPGYVEENIPETQPVMFLGLEKITELVHARTPTGTSEMVFVKILFLHKNNIWSILVEEKCNISERLKLAV